MAQVDRVVVVVVVIVVFSTVIRAGLSSGGGCGCTDLGVGRSSTGAGTRCWHRSSRIATLLLTRALGGMHQLAPHLPHASNSRDGGGARHSEYFGDGVFENEFEPASRTGAAVKCVL